MHVAENKTTYSTDASNNKMAGNALFFRPGFSVNSPGDAYEQEADAMADKVMRMQIPGPQNTFFKPAISSIQRKCATCEEENHIHRKKSSGLEVNGSNELDSYVASLNSSGQALPETSRNFFEPRFGHDFSNVRVHTDSVAAKSAQAINALAYTTGNNIVFNQGQYAPGSEQGQRLMAHELTHVVQQNSEKPNGTIQKQEAATPAATSVKPGAQTPRERQCESDFNECIKHSDSPMECIAKRSFCLSAPDIPGQDFVVCARRLQPPVEFTGSNHSYVETPTKRYAIITPCTSKYSFILGGVALKTDRSPDPCNRPTTCVACVPKPGVTDLNACFESQYSAYAAPSAHQLTGPNSNTFAGTLGRACCANMDPQPSALGSLPGWGDPPAAQKNEECPTGPPVC